MTDSQTKLFSPPLHTFGSLYWPSLKDYNSAVTTLNNYIITKLYTHTHILQYINFVLPQQSLNLQESTNKLAEQ